MKLAEGAAAAAGCEHACQAAPGASAEGGTNISWALSSCVSVASAAVQFVSAAIPAVQAGRELIAALAHAITSGTNTTRSRGPASPLSCTNIARPAQMLLPTSDVSAGTAGEAVTGATLTSAG